MMGGYALVIKLSNKSEIVVGRKLFNLPSGTYVYSGSALGPGGIEARVRRHLEIYGKNAENDRLRNKEARWHIDRLLKIANNCMAIHAQSDSNIECSLIHVLKKRDFKAINGFGSTDCKSGCGGHLLLAPSNDFSSVAAEVKFCFKELGLNPEIGFTDSKD